SGAKSDEAVGVRRPRVPDGIAGIGFAGLRGSAAGGGGNGANRTDQWQSGGEVVVGGWWWWRVSVGQKNVVQVPPFERDRVVGIELEGEGAGLVDVRLETQGDLFPGSLPRVGGPEFD